jgi:hypothetical protein
MSICKHDDLLKIFDFVDNKKQVKEFICESCLVIFQTCNADEHIAKTPEHSSSCSHCFFKKKKPKAHIVKDSWQEQLQEYVNETYFDKPTRSEKKKRLARA